MERFAEVLLPLHSSSLVLMIFNLALEIVNPLLSAAETNLIVHSRISATILVCKWVIHLQNCISLPAQHCLESYNMFVQINAFLRRPTMRKCVPGRACKIP